MFGDQLRFGDGVAAALSCAHAKIHKPPFGDWKEGKPAIAKILCTDCNQWVEVQGRGGELVQTSSEESINGSNVG